MKRKLLFLAFFGLLGFCCAAELPDPNSIKTDIVIATINGKTGDIPCLVVRENYYQVDMRKDASDKAGKKMPRANVDYVFYREADNESYIEGLKAYEKHDYTEAIEYFKESLGSLKDFTSVPRKEAFAQYVYYHLGMCQMSLGDYAEAIKNFDLCLQPKDAIYSYQAEYYRTRCLEGMGEYQKASSKYNVLLNAVYPELLKKAPNGKMWEYLCKLGLQRSKLLEYTQRPGQDANVTKALEEFESLIQKNADKLTQEMKDDALLVRINANKYLAQKDPAKYAEVIQTLSEPIRKAIAENNKSALNWMYPALADSYYGQMQAATDETKKKDLAQMALFEYMRVCLVSNAAPQDLCSAYYNSGTLFEQLKGTDWQKRALQQYKRAANPAYKKFQDYVKALESVKRLSEENKDAK